MVNHFFGEEFVLLFFRHLDQLYVSHCWKDLFQCASQIRLRMSFLPTHFGGFWPYGADCARPSLGGYPDPMSDSKSPKRSQRGEG